VCPVISAEPLFVLITPTSPKHRDLVRDGRYALLVADAKTRAAVLHDARNRADESEALFELWVERVMHTRWENVLTPDMRPVRQKWRAS
jgi:hypothetical protein